MSFAEYRMLNTDPEILSESVVKEQIKDAEEKNSVSTKIIEYKGKKYLSIIAVAQNSKMHVAYFHPINQLFGPVQKNIYITILLAILTVIAAIFIILSFSKHFTNPIVELKMRLKKICCGEYDEHLNAKNFFGEFITLSGSFNTMLDTINNYRNNMEQIVHERTEELNKTVAQLTETHEQNKRELAMAQKIQSSLVPKIFPETKLLQFSSKYMPMEALGGDLYDVYQISDKVFAVMILDVCGHGVPAALITTMAKMSFTTNSKKYSTPSEIVSHVNLELAEILEGSGNFLTAFYAIIDIENKIISYTNAGHNTIYILHENKTISCLPNNSPVIGVIKDLDFLQCNESLSSGDRIILYTDGLIETRNPTGAMFDTPRLLEIIEKNSKVDIHTFVTQLCDCLKSFQELAPVTDDVALLVIDTIFFE
jgi:sigma-B regulation protein RsbU (phosphoserine phosphatase)